MNCLLSETSEYWSRPIKYSILVPTRNREELLPALLDSLQKQTYKNFEIVLADNGTEPLPLYKVENLKYIRTGPGLSMVENWKAAHAAATGDYIIVLSDKMRLCTDALELINIAARQGHPVVVYGIATQKSSNTVLRYKLPAFQVLSTAAMLQKFQSMHVQGFDDLPKGTNCAFKRNLLSLEAFEGTCPDYAVGFRLLKAVHSVCVIKAPLANIPRALHWNPKYSNGVASYIKSESFKETVTNKATSTPIQSRSLWVNMVLSDYYKHYNTKINPAQYMCFVLVALLIATIHGVFPRQDLSDWWNAYKQFTMHQKLQAAFQLPCTLAAFLRHRIL